MSLAIMEHETTLEYTVPLLREAVRGFWRRSVGAGLFIAIAICAGMLIFLLMQGDRSWVVGVIAAVLAFGAMLAAAVYVVHFRNSLQKFRDMGSPQAIFKASEHSFTVISAAGTSTLPWSSVKEVWKFKNCWLLLFSKAQFMTLPLACIPEETRAFIINRVAAGGGKADG